MNLSIKREGENKYIECVMGENDRADIVTINMLALNQVEGVLEPTTSEVSPSWRYEAADLISLSDLMGRSDFYMTKDVLLKILNNLLDTIKNLEQYMIPVWQIALEPDYVFLDVREYWTYLICVPFLQEKKNVLDMFLKHIAENAKPHPEFTHNCLDRLKEVGIWGGTSQELEKLIREMEGIQEVRQTPVPPASFVSPIPPVPPVPPSGPVPPVPPIPPSGPVPPSGSVSTVSTSADVSAHNENDETVVWNNIRGMLIRQRNQEKRMIDKAEVKLGKEYTSVDYFLSDNPTISRVHAKIINRDDRYFVVDCRSTNRTYVNGKMIMPEEEIEIKDGDILRLSNEEFLFKLV